MKDTFKFLDIAKFIAAVLVLLLHAAPLSDINTFLNQSSIGISRIAVPFFFSASAYIFSAAHKDPSQNDLGKYILRLCKYWFVFTLVGITFLRPALNFSIVRTILFDGFYTTWFFHAMIVSMSIAFLLIKSNHKWTFAFGLSLLFYVLGVLMNTYYSTLPTGIASFLDKYYYPFFVTSRNGFFSGTVYCVMGFYIAEKKPYVKRPYLLFLLSFAVFMAELFVTFAVTEKVHGRELFITVPLLIYSVYPALFDLEKKYANKISASVCVYLRKMSFGLYVWQGVFLTLIPGHIHSLVRFILILSVTMGFSSVLLYLSKTKCMKWLNGRFI